MLVIFTAFLALFTFLLLLLARTAKKDTRILQRAYIAVEPQGIHLMSNGSDLIGHIGMKNAGHLPARKVGWFINIKHSSNGEEPETFFKLESEKGNIVVAPGTVATRGSPTSVLVADLPARSETELPAYLYVWGSVHYDNGFRRICTTKFCHRYNWKSRGRGHIDKYEIAAAYARYHEHGNDAD